jgi:hypothetical protein
LTKESHPQIAKYATVILENMISKHFFNLFNENLFLKNKNKVIADRFVQEKNMERCQNGEHNSVGLFFKN